MTKAKKVIEFKDYLSRNNPVVGKLYFGKVDHNVDSGFESSVKLLEKKISKAINHSIEGQLWTSAGFNYNADINDLSKAISIIKSAQASVQSTVFTGKPSEEEEDILNFFAPKTISNMDPYNTEVDITTNGIYPANSPSTLTQDDRILELFKLLEEK